MPWGRGHHGREWTWKGRQERCCWRHGDSARKLVFLGVWWWQWASGLERKGTPAPLLTPALSVLSMWPFEGSLRFPLSSSLACFSMGPSQTRKWHLLGHMALVELQDHLWYFIPDNHPVTFCSLISPNLGAEFPPPISPTIRTVSPLWIMTKWLLALSLCFLYIDENVISCLYLVLTSLTVWWLSWRTLSLWNFQPKWTLSSFC